jgi:hypothetical protein
VNITVKAPPDGRYNVDVQRVKEKYMQWRYSVLAGAILWFGFFCLWIFFTVDTSKSQDLWSSLIAAGEYYIFTWYGWVVLVYLTVGYFLYDYLINKKMHFQCPFYDCNTQIYINEPWQCPYCRSDVNFTYPTLYRRTFFDKCKNGHKPESYQCPTCAEEGRPGIFELIPNGRMDKFAKKAIFNQQNVVQLPPPVQGQVMPRDRNFF